MSGLIGRETGHVRLRVVGNTQALTLCPFVEQFTQPDALVYTDEYLSYNALKRTRETVCHGAKEWTRNDDGDGWFETHTNTQEGLWTGLRNFLRPFAVFTNVICTGMLLFTSLGSISRQFRLLSSRL